MLTMERNIVVNVQGRQENLRNVVCAVSGAQVLGPLDIGIGAVQLGELSKRVFEGTARVPQAGLAEASDVTRTLRCDERCSDVLVTYDGKRMFSSRAKGCCQGPRYLTRCLRPEDQKTSVYIGGVAAP